MKLLSARQIQQLDQLTMEREPIASIDLMERAAGVFTDWLVETYPDTERPVVVVCGPGNNGGDGLVAARMLHGRFFDVTVFICQIGSGGVSEDHRINRERLAGLGTIIPRPIKEGDKMPEIPANALLIDAIFGSGLNRPVEGYWAELLQHLNRHAGPRIAVDIPSGLFADQPTTGPSLLADRTFSFEMPKLAFLFPENEKRVGEWDYASIGLHRDSWEALDSPYYLLEKKEVAQLLKKRRTFDHKGIYGHALLVMGHRGTVGAAILAGRATLRAGAGLLSIHAPRCAYTILQSSFPEAMVSVDQHETCFTSIEEHDLSAYAAIGIGCGLGTNRMSRYGMQDLLHRYDRPMVIDADGLNLLAQEPELLQQVPPNSILTPHPGEYRRLFGENTDSFARLQQLRKQARRLNLFILLKGAYSAVACPDGRVYFNSTGNPGMGTAGSGDVLTGILCGLLAQGYEPREAACLGVFLHGLAGDLAVLASGSEEALIAGDLIDHLGLAYKTLHACQKK